MSFCLELHIWPLDQYCKREERRLTCRGAAHPSKEMLVTGKLEENRGYDSPDRSARHANAGVAGWPLSQQASEGEACMWELGQHVVLVRIQKGRLRQNYSEVKISPPCVKNPGVRKGWPGLQANSFNCIRVKA